MLSNSLKRKFILGFLLLFLLVAGLTSYLTIATSDQYQQEFNQKLNFEVAEHIVAETALLHDNQINQKQLKDLFHQLMVFNPSIELYLLDPKGEILAYSAPEGVVKRARVNLNPIKEFLNKDAQLPLKGDDPRHHVRKKVFSAAPILTDEKLTGYLYIILDSQQVDSIMQRVKSSQILSLSVTGLIVGILFAFLVGYALFQWMMQRLQSLAHSVHDYPLFSNAAFVSEPVKGDEIDQLSHAFRVMAKKIDDQLDAIQAKDTARRELVANVSHDLRTPLATLRGYIETLALGQADLTPQQHQEYLSIAMKHCAHLSGLVDQLFELARYDAHDIHPEFEAFNLSELIQDCLAKFHLKAQQKQISLSIQADRTTPFVFADISLIERVFENLIENALRHTPSGGLVNVLLLPGGDQLNVSVQDSGEGISERDIPHVFDRFYQKEKSRSSPSNAGLGLAIVKRIVELHQGQITVKSEQQRGTEFQFSLPVASCVL